ncbi:ABC transporter permease [Spirosoma sp. BT702]|uniref:ABC transporter permease n=1 Tax=Spirosoma profusum TaxID=2771354 RepID=A0A927AU42_9BACT|nr:permease prefix domain 2-containing transporter [Spirosoma profusum]MBD2702342.1 ABC transporter permease [Spirosoma profusum]
MKPPHLADRLLRLFCAPHRLEEVQGDLHEEFAYQVRRIGERRARWRYWWDVVGFLKPTFSNKRQPETYSTTHFLHPVMIQNYIKIAFRNLQKNKVSSLVNILGLTLGLVCCMLITAYVLDDLTYDQFHKKSNRIVLFQQFENSASSGGKFATDLKQRFSAVSDAVRLSRIKPLIANRQTAAYESNFWFADSSAFNVFTLPLVQGNPQTALTEQYGIVLSEGMARKYFGATNPVGQTLRINNKATLHVTGVLRDLPTNSHLKLDFLANYANANELAGYDVTNNYWGSNDTWTYLLLAPGADIATLKAQFSTYTRQLGDPNTSVWKLNLIPLTDIYLRTNLVATNRLTYAYVFAIVALLILGLACFNYVNLATARATQRAKEVGVRKVLGSSFGQLWGQFLGETSLFLVIAVILSVGVVVLSLPLFNELADKQLTVQSMITSERIGWLLTGLVLVGLLAGSYPAFVLSSFRPIAALTSSRLPNGGGGWLRKTLIVGQFAVSIGMIVATLVVYKQLQFVQQRNVGYQRDQILTMDLRDAPDQAKELFKQRVAQLPNVEGATRAFSLPGSGSLRGEKILSEYVPKGSKTGGIGHLSVDGDFLKTFDIKIINGRNLDPNRTADKQAFLVNRAAMNYFGWKNIDGKMTGYYTYGYDPANPKGYREIPLKGQVIGVIDDYNHADLKQKVEPMIISLNSGWEGQFAARIRAGAIPGTIQQIQQYWHEQFPDKPFLYVFLDDTFNRTYRVETRTGQIFAMFAGLAVLISCLGLFGLATFTAEQRTKEIGVRKVLGASAVSIVTLLSKEFVKLILLAILIASPLAWWAMNQWLQAFVYKIDIDGWVFVLAGLLALTIALLTVGLQSVRAALMNPVKSLRSE